jgi:hypothetical protein
MKEQKKVFSKYKKLLYLLPSPEKAIFSFSAVAVYSQYCVEHYATNWKVAGSIPDEVMGIFD